MTAANPENLTKIRGKCLAALARREHSQQELREKCTEFPTEDVENVLAEFISRGWQSDQRFAESFTRSKATRGQGILKVQQGLKQKGITGELQQQALAEIDWFAIAIEVYQRKYSTPAQTPKERLKRQRFLLQRGFTFEQIKTAEKYSF